MSRIIENFQNEKVNYGKKGNNLKIIMKLFANDNTINVPETLILPIPVFKEIINENGETDFSNYNNIYINPQLKEEILNSIHNKFGNKKLVIRSSATCEDSIFFSASGQYDSFLNISSDEQIIEAIKKVYASLFNKNSKLYSKIYNINLRKENMAVLIQEVAPVIQSGVAFSCNPVNNEKEYIIEFAKGLGTNVVEGIGNINQIEIKYSEKVKVKDPLIIKLIKSIDAIKKEFGHNVDIEWGIDKNNILYIFQARPIVYKDTKFSIKYDNDLVTKKCIPISKGFTIGTVQNITENKSGCILYQNEKYDFNDMALLLSSRGVILKSQAKLSHFSNILRELVKPCVYTENFKFKKDNLYAVDAFNGNIIDFGKVKPKDKIELMFSAFEYMKTILNDSFEKYNGILSIKNDDKYEEVVFNINEKEIINKLIDNGFTKKTIKQSIYTYDFKDKFLIDNNVILRIQISNKKINVQYKLLDTSHKKYRKERGIIINFDSLKNAKDFMKSYTMVETGYQERKITKYVKDNMSVNITKWPGCDPYLGVEGQSFKDLEYINDKLNLNDCTITGFGGKEIFNKLNLDLNECKFK